MQAVISRNLTVNIQQMINRSSQYYPNYVRRNIAALCRTAYSTAAVPDMIRNIGIIAHVDAGKTTTTERFLYYSGRTRAIGEVHDGDTVMDFLSEERERGITIQSAVTSFTWEKHSFNLIDTPGHIDFSIEVERALRVLDGAVVILDGINGVQAQTETVWRQADKFDLPKLAFVNKLDRKHTDIECTLYSLKNRLGVTPLLIQFPVRKDDELVGIVDIINRRYLQFDGSNGENMKVLDVEDEETKTELMTRRENLIEAVAEYDETIMNAFVEGTILTDSELRDGIRRVLLGNRSKVTVVLCGSAYKNIGIQPLLTGVIEYLPSPVESAPVTSNEGVSIPCSKSSDLCGLAFKVIRDPKRGPIVFARIYSGVLQLKDIASVSSDPSVKSRVTRLLRIEADTFTEIDHVEAGQVCAIVGLRAAKTGDTILHQSNKSTITLPGIIVPPPVYARSIEAESASQADALQEALAQLHQEDPSFSYFEDRNSGQIIVRGMGELHLEILSNKLQNEMKIKAEMGKLQVAYRETVSRESSGVGRSTDSASGDVTTISLTLLPAEEEENVKVEFNLGNEQHGGTTMSEDKKRMTVEAIEAATNYGPLAGYPLSKVIIRVDSVAHYDSTDLPSLITCASIAIKEASEKGELVLLEPIMKLDMSVPKDYLSDVVSDLSSRRRAMLHEVQFSDTNVEAGAQLAKISADVPSAEMLGYSTTIRSLTQGHVQYSLQFSGYQQTSQTVQKNVLEKMQLLEI